MSEGEFIRVVLSNGEAIDIPEVAIAALQAAGHTPLRIGDDIAIDAGHFSFTPRLLTLDQDEDGGFHTSCVVQFSHPELFPNGAMEYQHAWGETAAASLRKGFDHWAAMDVPTLIDALAEQPKRCTFMDMDWPDDATGGNLKRRVVLGPTGHLRSDPDAAAEDEDHPFCPCCLTTKSLEAFTPLLRSEGSYALRLFAARNEHGEASADCRVNGEDFDPGMQALRAYAASWPFQGIEFRKQFVVIRSV